MRPPRPAPDTSVRISPASWSAVRARACGTVVAMNDRATGASAAIMFVRSLSAMAAKTIGSFWLPVSCRYDASAAAPAGLCAASISSSLRPACGPVGGTRVKGTRSHSSRAGHSHRVRPVTIASVGHVADQRRPALEDGDRDRGVLELMASGERERQRRILAIGRRSRARRRSAPRPRGRPWRCAPPPLAAAGRRPAARRLWRCRPSRTRCPPACCRDAARDRTRST